MLVGVIDSFISRQGKQFVKTSSGQTAGCTASARRPSVRVPSVDMTASPTHLLLSDAIPIERWIRIGKKLCEITNSSAWWLGDWLLFGECTYPPRYKEAIIQTGLEYKTLRNYAWVARHVPPGQRISRLSFQHHAEVAALDPQHQAELLEHAMTLGWTRDTLRAQVRALRDRMVGHQPHQPPSGTLTLTLDSDQIDRWKAQAETANSSVISWVVNVVESAIADGSTPDYLSPTSVPN